MIIKDIIFDWGGVLSPPHTKIAAKRLALRHDVDEKIIYKELDETEGAYSTSSKSSQYYKNISDKFGIPVNEIKEVFSDVIPGTILSLAKELSDNGYRVYILSNQIKPRTDAIREKIDLSFFKRTFFSNEIGLKKPSKEVFEYVLEEIGKNPNECVFIDDRRINLLAAKEVGLEVIQIQFEEIEKLKQKLEIFGVTT